jgi:hypothetical protein
MSNKDLIKQTGNLVRIIHDFLTTGKNKGSSQAVIDLKDIDGLASMMMFFILQPLPVEKIVPFQKNKRSVNVVIHGYYIIDIVEWGMANYAFHIWSYNADRYVEISSIYGYPLPKMAEIDAIAWIAKEQIEAQTSNDSSNDSIKLPWRH